MPGKRIEYGGFVTHRTSYRENIAAADSSGPTDPTIPVLDTRSVTLGPSNIDVNHQGMDARIFAACILNGITAATIQVWLKGELDTFPPESSSSSSLGSGDDWVLAQSTNITGSTLVKVLDIPPGLYKILVSSVTGSGEITIRTQHAG
jgi:hypothetical protein